MDGTSAHDHRTGMAPITPAQMYAALAGLFLVALGVLSLVIKGVNFGTVGTLANQPEFLIWTVSGWTTIFWIAMGGLGLLAVPRLASARTYALFAGIVFATAAVWGFIDGNDVVSLIAADTTNNITHAILGGAGLLAGLLPARAQQPEPPAQSFGRREGVPRDVPQEHRTLTGRR